MNFQTYIKLRKKAFDLVKEKSGDDTRYSSPIKDDQPIWIHLMNVHNFLITKGIEDYETLLAAILHDIVEDYDVTINDLKNEFSEKVANIVDRLTKRAGESNLEYFTKIRNYHSPAPIEIKVADKIDNALTHYCYWDKKLKLERVWSEFDNISFQWQEN